MELFCILYYIFSYAQSIPCIIKLVRTKSSNDYSLFMRLFQFIALACWLIYILTTDTSLFVRFLGIFDVFLVGSENVLILTLLHKKSVDFSHRMSHTKHTKCRIKSNSLKINQNRRNYGDSSLILYSLELLSEKPTALAVGSSQYYKFKNKGNYI